jgi:hypothetical protein
VKWLRLLLVPLFALLLACGGGENHSPVSEPEAPMVDLEIRVLKPDGHPAREFHVEIIPTQRVIRAFMDQNPRLIQQTDDAGILRVRLPREEHLFMIGPERFRRQGPVADEIIDLSDFPSRADDLTIQLHESRLESISGRVVDTESHPLAGVLVQESDTRPHVAMGLGPALSPVENALRRIAQNADWNLPHTFTDAEGRFDLRIPTHHLPVQFGAVANDHLLLPRRERVYLGESDVELVMRPVSEMLTVRVRSESASFEEMGQTRADLYLPAGEESHCRWTLGQRQNPWLRARPGSMADEGHVFEFNLWMSEVASGESALCMIRTASGEAAALKFTPTRPPEGVLDLGDLPLEPGHALRGQVVSTPGEPVSGAAVQVEGHHVGIMVFASSRPQWRLPDRPPPPGGTVRRFASLSMGALTDAEGRFEISPLPSRTWSVQARHPDHAYGVFDVTLSTASDVTLTLDPLPDNEVVVHVNGAEGAPLEGTSVSLMLLRPGRILTEDGVSQITDAQGEARLERVDAGVHRLSVTVEPGGSHVRHWEEIEISEGDEEWTVDLSQWHSLSGRITRGGYRFAGLPLLIEARDRSVRANLRTDARGEFETLLPPGDYRITWGFQSFRQRFLCAVELSEDLRIEEDTGEI